MSGAYGRTPERAPDAAYDRAPDAANERAPEQVRDAAFDAAMERAGIPVPAAWYAGSLASYRELTAMTGLLRTAGRPVDSEPSSVYVVPAGGGRD